MKIFTRLLVAIAGAFLLCTGVLAQDKVVYHIDNAQMQATKGLRNIRNHLDVAPQTKIVVVTHGAGIDLLLSDAKDDKVHEFSGQVSALASRGVEPSNLSLGLPLCCMA